MVSKSSHWNQKEVSLQGLTPETHSAGEVTVPKVPQFSKICGPIGQTGAR